MREPRTQAAMSYPWVGECHIAGDFVYFKTSKILDKEGQGTDSSNV